MSEFGNMQHRAFEKHRNNKTYLKSELNVAMGRREK
jgi:hypothetical protein